MEQKRETPTTPKGFFEELIEMPYLDRCLVLGIVLGTPQKEILQTIKISPQDYRIKVHEQGLNKWNILRRLLGN